MRAIERTTRVFVASVRAALPDVNIRVERSVNRAGRSNYVFIYAARPPRIYEKVRISDHPVGMRRARWGSETLFLHAGADINHWSVWLGQLVKSQPICVAVSEKRSPAGLFADA